MYTKPGAAVGSARVQASRTETGNFQKLVCSKRNTQILVPTIAIYVVFSQGGPGNQTLRRVHEPNCNECASRGTMPARHKELPFKPRARLLLLLGDQLIRNAGIAVFELVKNAYDADAEKVTVTMTNVASAQHGRIVVEDDGCGMNWQTVTGHWLEPGTDYRTKDGEGGGRTTKFNRLPLGEKGVGRFAAHKLGDEIILITRSEENDEIVVNIDWRSFESSKYLEDVKVTVRARPPECFKGDKTGTRIEIGRLRTRWNRGMVRELHRNIVSICSPFQGVGEFTPKLVLTQNKEWLEGLIKLPDALASSLFRASCVMDGEKLDYDYSFEPFPGMDRVEPRKRKESLNLRDDPKKPEETSRWSLTDGIRIGKVRLDLSAFDLEPQTLALGVADKKGLKEFLKLNGGIRVYRSGIRVYNYGEPENDWLGLGGRRVNVPASRISSNLIIGAVSLSGEDSIDLQEKTNREGFVENEAYIRFRNAVLFAVKQIETERNFDKKRIRVAYSSQEQKEPVLEDLADLRTEVEKRGLAKDLGPYLDRIENQFQDVKDTLLTAAGTGLSLAVVIHEVEKGINLLSIAVKRDSNMKQVRALATHLSELVDGLAYLARGSGFKEEKASTLIRHAILNTRYRTQYHKISIVNGLKMGNSDFSVRCSRRLIIATLMNLIDNSIWWLDNKGGADKSIFLGTSNDLSETTSIVVADNGPGFIDPPEYLVVPFLSRKPDGMGLGLHVASEVMKTHNGRLEFPDKGDVELPDGFAGAVVALVFGSKS